MEININNLKNNVIELNKIINEYENTYLNMYNNVYDIKENWIGEKSVSFFEKNSLEQKKISNCIEELKSLILVYTYIINEYSNISYKIFINLDLREKINNCFNKYIELIDKVNVLCNNIPNMYISFIENIKIYFNNLKDKIIYLKQNYNDICDKIIEIENNISIKISKINIELINETDIRNM